MRKIYLILRTLLLLLVIIMLVAAKMKMQGVSGACILLIIVLELFHVYIKDCEKQVDAFVNLLQKATLSVDDSGKIQEFITRIKNELNMLERYIYKVKYKKGSL